MVVPTTSSYAKKKNTAMATAADETTEAYLAHHAVPALFRDLLARLIDHRPDDPLAFLSALLRRRRGLPPEIVRPVAAAAGNPARAPRLTPPPGPARRQSRRCHRHPSTMPRPA